MKCGEVKELFALAYEDAMTDSMCTEFEAHLDQCPECLTDFVTYKQRRCNCSEAYGVCGCDEFWQGFYTKLAADKIAEEKFSDRWNRWRLAHFPSALCSISSFGLVKLGFLMLLVTALLILFRSDPVVSAEANDATPILMNTDSSGMHSYQDSTQ